MTRFVRVWIATVAAMATFLGLALIMAQLIDALIRWTHPAVGVGIYVLLASAFVAWFMTWDSARVRRIVAAMFPVDRRS